MPRGGYKTVSLAPTFGLPGKASKRTGYRRWQVTFQRRTLKVARLVCEAFHGPAPEGKPNVLHRDENSAHNSPDNLYWGTQKENLNAPGFVAYCRSRTGDSSPYRKGKALQRGAQ